MPAHAMATTNAPDPGAGPATMDGFVADYISTYRAVRGEDPDYVEYRQIMQGHTTAQVPVLSEIARGFAVFDHWFSEVPSQTFPNRSFWTAATSSGLVVNSPATDWYFHNTAETIFDRLEAHGRTWKVYVLEPSPMSITGAIHTPRLKKRFHERFVPFAEFERDAAAGTLPDFALIEPNLLSGHADYHPPFGETLVEDVDMGMDTGSAVDAGEQFLARVYSAVRNAPREGASTVWNTMLLIGWDEPGGTYDHVPPPAVEAPDDSPGQLGFGFDRSGYRVPAVLVSPWVPERTVVSEEYRHTSLIATLRTAWGLGDTPDPARRVGPHLRRRCSPSARPATRRRGRMSRRGGRGVAPPVRSGQIGRPPLPQPRPRPGLPRPGPRHPPWRRTRDVRSAPGRAGLRTAPSVVVGRGPGIRRPFLPPPPARPGSPEPGQPPGRRDRSRRRGPPGDRSIGRAW